MLALAGALSTFTMLRLRVWNPSDQRSQPTKPEGITETKVLSPKVESVWHNPIIWREMCTSAMAEKCSLSSWPTSWLLCRGSGLPRKRRANELILGMISPAGFAFVGVGLLSFDVD